MVRHRPIVRSVQALENTISIRSVQVPHAKVGKHLRLHGVVQKSRNQSPLACSCNIFQKKVYFLWSVLLLRHIR